MKEFKRLQKQLQVIHDKTGYEDLEHGVLALQIAEHTVEETLEHTGLGGEIQRKPNPAAHRRAKQWREIVKGLRSEEHTSELQSLTNLVCRLLLEKKKKTE